MKKFYLSLGVFAVAAVWGLSGLTASARENGGAPAVLPSSTIVISQFQAGGGAATDEFVELHNVGSTPVDLNGYRVVYRSAAGTTDVGPFASWSTSTVLQPGQYYLIASLAYDGGVTPDVTWNTSIGSMGGAGGGLAIRPSVAGTPIDSVGWGTATNVFVETTVTGAPGDNNSQSRKINGCQDTDNNSADFVNAVPSVPRNTSTTTPCATDPTQLYASIAANPSTVAPGATTLLTVTVVPATTPPSTFIAVGSNLSDIGGPSSQPFFDNGTNGDVTPGDNVFSFLATVSAGTSGGNHVVVAAAADFQGRTVPLVQNITVSAALPDEDPLIFGNPSGATNNVANENNYLMQKTQYSLSYSRQNATPNWVAWRLDSTWIGGAPRQDDYRADPALPAAWYHVQDNDYSGSGFDRGHMCPSGDRTRSIPDNSATFLMTNFVPQLGANNQGPWNDFENYCRTLAAQGNELYIITGGQGNIGTIAAGQVVVPKVTWKVVIVLPNGSNDVQRVNKATRAFGIIVPNQAPIVSNQWETYRVTVDKVEALTGYNFFSAVRKNTQELIERRRDTQ